MDWEWAGNELGMGWEWTGNGLGMGWEWVGNGLGMGRELTEDGPEIKSMKVYLIPKEAPEFTCTMMYHSSW